MEYRYHGLDPETKVCHLLNGNRCDKMPTIVAAFNVQYVEKQGPIVSVKVASITQSRPAKKQKTSKTCNTFNERVELENTE